MVDRGTPEPMSIVALPNDGDWNKYVASDAEYDLFEPQVTGLPSFKRRQARLKRELHASRAKANKEAAAAAAIKSASETDKSVPTSDATATANSGKKQRNKSNKSAPRKLPLGVSTLGISAHQLPAPVRQTIGYVTSGSQSFARGVGHAIAFCNLREILLAQRHHHFVWVRKPSSAFYQAVRFSVLSE